ncbi:mitochondrial F1F0-ATP synthase-like protein g subunit [Byssothecium circinans]|uniref:Mitochondrial F1F0-ATP synthase-like protein g subunit n=1 Tax=Byssothecium circinans TaxID=147558 RepID=A0A6A5TSD0_9PLEO|nr:mitochondrial F1F0-ATP synthase-like protein g subunit [Byssothecium circinans]
MSAVASRAVLRQSRFAVRRAGVRNASSTTEAAKEKATEASSKASEGLSRVTSSAGAAASKASSATANAAGQAQAKTGGIVQRVQALIPRVTYYSRVGLELGKLIAHQRAMAPPNVATIQSYFQPAINAARHPATLFNQAANSSAAQPINVLNQVRSLSRAQWLSAGVVAAEVIGFFTVGEMVGRLKIVGYRANTHAAH